MDLQVSFGGLITECTEHPRDRLQYMREGQERIVNNRSRSSGGRHFQIAVK